MRFEDALSALREGKKIRHPCMPEDEYYMRCRARINPKYFPVDAQPCDWESIVWMKGNREHPDMRPHGIVCKHGFSPMMNLFWVISDEWVLRD